MYSKSNIFHIIMDSSNNVPIKIVSMLVIKTQRDDFLPWLQSWRNSMVGEFPVPGWRIWSIQHCTWKTCHFIHVQFHYWAFVILWGGYAHTFTCLVGRSRLSWCLSDGSVTEQFHNLASNLKLQSHGNNHQWRSIISNPIN